MVTAIQNPCDRDQVEWGVADVVRKFSVHKVEHRKQSWHWSAACFDSRAFSMSLGQVIAVLEKEILEHNRFFQKNPKKDVDLPWTMLAKKH